MPDFMTETEIESYLVMETRDLPLPEGGKQSVTAMRSLWASLESVLAMSSFTLDEIVGLTRMSIQEKGYSFQEAFEAVVSFMHKEIASANGYR